MSQPQMLLAMPTASAPARPQNSNQLTAGSVDRTSKFEAQVKRELGSADRSQRSATTQAGKSKQEADESSTSKTSSTQSNTSAGDEPTAAQGLAEFNLLVSQEQAPTHMLTDESAALTAQLPVPLEGLLEQTPESLADTEAEAHSPLTDVAASDDAAAQATASQSAASLLAGAATEESGTTNIDQSTVHKTARKQDGSVLPGSSAAPVSQADSEDADYPEPTLVPSEKPLPQRTPATPTAPAAVDGPRPATSETANTSFAVPANAPLTDAAAPTSVRPVQAPPATTPAGMLEQVRGPVGRLVAAPAGEHTFTVNVTPENLGPVTVRAHIGTEGIRVELIGATDAARDSLRAIMNDLKRDLQSTGMNAQLNLSSDSAQAESHNEFGQQGFGSDSNARRSGVHAGVVVEADQGVPLEPAPLLNDALSVDILA